MAAEASIIVDAVFTADDRQSQSSCYVWSISQGVASMALESQPQHVFLISLDLKRRVSLNMDCRDRRRTGSEMQTSIVVS